MIGGNIGNIEILEGCCAFRFRKWYQWIVDTDNRVFGTNLQRTHWSLMIYKDDDKQEILRINAKCFMMIS